MAGFNVGGLPYFLQYQGQLQQQQQAQQEQAMRLQAFQQQQQDRQRAQAAQAAAGNALPQLFAQQQQPAPMAPPPQQTPAPGQASVPMVQPGQMQAPPANQQVNLPPLPPGGMPQGASTGAPGTPPLPPFKPMPTQPPAQQAAPAPSISAPPGITPPAQPQAGGPLTIQGAIKVLQDQGLEGADLMAGLAQLQPLLDSQAKAQAAQLEQQFNNQLKLQAVQDRHDALDQRREAAQQASEDRRLSIQQRADAARESAALRAETIALRKAQVAATNGEDAKFSPDDLKFLAEQARAGDTSVYQNLGRGAQGAKNIIALRREVMRQSREAGEGGADVAAANAGFQGEKAAARTSGTKAANVDLAVSEAQKTFPIVREASAALPRTQFPGVNRALQAAQTGSGDPKVVALGTALNTAVNAYARAISPSGTPTVSDKEHARELLSTASTPEQLNAVLNVMDKEMAAARQAPKEVKAAQKARISGRAEDTPAPAAGGLPAGWTVTEH
jgi:hypothetical protein